VTREEVVKFIQEVRFGCLATVAADNTPRVRPVAIYQVYGDELFFFTFSITRKVAEIEAHPQVEVVWSKMAESAQVRIRGQAAVVEDQAMQQRFRDDNPMVAELLPAGAEHLFRLYSLRPETVEMAVGLVPYTEVVW
jgi:uncharacterized pyridoxamine 5'-phosphate oxidase family protein